MSGSEAVSIKEALPTQGQTVGREWLPLGQSLALDHEKKLLIYSDTSGTNGKEKTDKQLVYEVVNNTKAQVVDDGLLGKELFLFPPEIRSWKKANQSVSGGLAVEQGLKKLYFEKLSQATDEGLLTSQESRHLAAKAIGKIGKNDPWLLGVDPQEALQELTDRMESNKAKLSLAKLRKGATRVTAGKEVLPEAIGTGLMVGMVGLGRAQNTRQVEYVKEDKKEIAGYKLVNGILITIFLLESTAGCSVSNSSDNSQGQEGKMEATPTFKVPATGETQDSANYELYTGEGKVPVFGGGVGKEVDIFELDESQLTPAQLEASRINEYKEAIKQWANKVEGVDAQKGDLQLIWIQGEDGMMRMIGAWFNNDGTGAFVFENENGKLVPLGGGNPFKFWQFESVLEVTGSESKERIGLKLPDGQLQDLFVKKEGQWSYVSPFMDGNQALEFKGTDFFAGKVLARPAEFEAERLIAEAKEYLPKAFSTVFGAAYAESFDEPQIDKETGTIYADSDFWRINYVEGLNKWIIEARAETMDERLIEGVKRDYLKKHPEFKDWDEVRDKVLSLKGSKWRPQTPEMSYWTTLSGINVMNISGLEIGPVPMKVKGLDKNSYGLVDVIFRPSEENPDDFKANYAWGVIAYVENNQVLQVALPIGGSESSFSKSPNYYFKDFVVDADNTVLLKNNFKNFVLHRSTELKLVFSYLDFPLCGAVSIPPSDMREALSIDWLARLDRSKGIDLLMASYFMDFTPQGSVMIKGVEKLVKDLTWEELAMVLQEREEVPVATRVTADY